MTVETLRRLLEDSVDTDPVLLWCTLAGEEYPRWCTPANVLDDDDRVILTLRPFE